MTTPDWVDYGDKLGSIAGACIGVVSLGVALVSLRRQGTPAPSARRRAWLRVVVVLATLSIAASGVTWAFGWGWRPLGFVALGSGLAAVGLLAVVAVVRGRAPMSLPGPVRMLLAEQLGQAEQPRYDFGSLSPPSTLLIHVERQTTATDGPAIGGQMLTVAQMLRTARHAVVTGGPGVGKSTMVAHIVWAAGSWWLTARTWKPVRRAPYGPVIPVVVQARALVGSDLPAALADTWRHIEAVDRDTFANPPAPRASWLVLVDSLDEVADPASRATVLRRLGAHLDADAGRSRVVVATRPLSVEEFGDLSARGVPAFQLRPFAREDVGRFALRWFTVRSGGLYDPREEAARFLSRIRTSRLEPLVRVPLLCTMAALVYEADREMRLPTSRAELYAQFVGLLRGGRPAAGSAEPEPLAAWLADNVDALLATMAAAQCRADDRRLIEVAADWVRAEAPADLAAGPQASWISTVRSQLIVSGLCTQHGTNVGFIHHSVAEFLTADPRRSVFDPHTCRAGLLDPAARSLTLFVLARSGKPADALVEQLIEGPGAEPAAAGFIVADGIPVAAELRRRTVGALLAVLRTDDASAPDCLSVLAALGTDDEIRTELETVATDPAEGGWVRATLADALADLGVAAGTTVLRSLAEDPGHRQSVVGRWAAVRLAARTGRIAAQPAWPADVADLSRIGPLGRQALAATATDRRAKAGDRLEAASALYRLQDGAGQEVLRELARGDEAPAEVRRLAALALDGGGDPVGGEVLRRLAQPAADAVVPPQVRRQAAAALIERGDPAGVAALRVIAADRSLPKDEWRLAEAALAESGDPVGLEILAKSERWRSGRHARTAAQNALVLAAAGMLALALPGAADGVRIAGGVALFGAAGYALFGLVTIVAAWKRKATAAPRSTRHALSMLADAMARQWSSEATSREVGAPQLRVRWSTSRPGGRRAAAPVPSGSASEIVDAFRRLPGRQLLILGGPGTGKTTVVIGMLLALIAERDPEDPVPVLLPLAGWNPADVDLLGWVGAQLDGNYPFLADRRSGRRMSHELVESGRLLMIMDGFDELPPEFRARAADEIVDVVTRGLPLILTSRPRVMGHALRRLPVAELRPLSAADTVAGMVGGLAPPAQLRWAPVLEEVRQHPAGAAARALSTPLVVALARTAYADAGSHPVELLDPLRFRRPEAIESYLVDQLVPSAYRDHSRLATRWLAFLAALLEGQGTREFAWWRLAGALTMTVRGQLTGLVTGLSAAPAFVALTGSLVGLPFGAMTGLLVSLSAVRYTASAPTSRFLAAHSFAAGLRRARTQSLAAAAGTAAVIGVATALVEDIPAGLAMGGAGLVVALGPSPWGQWLLARVVLALTGRLPWRLVQFLADAADRGVLRAAGPFYRFRHFRLQERLSRARAHR